jgi:energy-coupling factor transporter ATP-binding protein EcfA2
MRLPPQEPDLSPWEPADVETIAHRLLRRAEQRRAGSTGTKRFGPLVVAVDGRSGSGKSTLADRLAGAVASAAVVRTDDVAWNSDFLEWHTLLVDGILAPLSRGEDVAFAPPAWGEESRAGAISVPANVAVLLLDGVGSSRESLTSWLDAAVWVQSDLEDSRRRGIERDVDLGRSEQEAVALWDEWQRQELPFLAADRPWQRADVVLCGTPGAEGTAAPHRGEVLVATGSAQRAQTGEDLFGERAEEP